MKRLETITSGCLKCKFIRCEKDLQGPEVYCKKNYSRPHIKEPDKYIGHCDHLDYDDASVAKHDENKRFCKENARERLVLS